MPVLITTLRPAAAEAGTAPEIISTKATKATPILRMVQTIRRAGWWEKH